MSNFPCNLYTTGQHQSVRYKYTRSHGSGRCGPIWTASDKVTPLSPDLHLGRFRAIATWPCWPPQAAVSLSPALSLPTQCSPACSLYGLIFRVSATFDFGVRTPFFSRGFVILGYLCAPYQPTYYSAFGMEQSFLSFRNTFQYLTYLQSFEFMILNTLPWNACGDSPTLLNTR